MKKNAKDKAPRKGGKPFFAHLLEAQELEQASGGVRPEAVTKKFPSDNDEGDKEPIFTTLKYPRTARTAAPTEARTARSAAPSSFPGGSRLARGQRGSWDTGMP
jgi:hypothetical protein